MNDWLSLVVSWLPYSSACTERDDGQSINLAEFHKGDAHEVEIVDYHGG